MILCRPVYQRASFTAFSFASAPPFVKKDIWRSPGVTSASSRASVDRASVAIGGAVGQGFSARFFVAGPLFGGRVAVGRVTRRAREAGEGLSSQSPKKRRPP